MPKKQALPKLPAGFIETMDCLDEADDGFGHGKASLLLVMTTVREVSLRIVRGFEYYSRTEGGGVEPLSLAGFAALQAAPSTGLSPSILR
jgi:hypothetical protein